MTDDAHRRAVLAGVLEKLRALSGDQRKSLCDAAKPLASAIPRAHQDALVKAELAHHALGGFKLTDLGKIAADVASNTPHLI